MEKVSHENFLGVTAHGYMEVVGEITVGNSMIFEEVKIPTLPDYSVTSEVNSITVEPDFKYIDNPIRWSRYCYRPKFKKKGCKNCVHHALPTGARLVPANKKGKQK